MIISIFNYAILSVILLLLALSILSRHRLLLALYLVGLCELGNIFPVFAPLRFELVVGAVLIIMVLMDSSKIAERSEIEVSRYFYLFFVFALVSVPQSVSPSDSLFWFIYYLKKCFIYYFGVVALIDDRKKLEGLTWVMMFGMFWFFGVPFVHYLQGNFSVVVKEVERVEGATGLNPNGLANNIIQALPLFYCMFFYEKNVLRKALLLVMGLIGFVTVFMTGSRGGFIGLVFLGLLLILYSKRKVIALALGSVTMGAMLVFFSGALTTRYSTILQLGDSGVSAKSRNVGLQHGISMLIRRPLLGVGIGAYPVARKAWYNWSLWAHNLYGQLMGELGILGTAAWVLMVYHTIAYARKIRLGVKEMEDHRFVCYLMMAVEISSYTRLVLGMTNHALHISFWYMNAALVVAAWHIIGGVETLTAETKGEEG